MCFVVVAFIAASFTIAINIVKCDIHYDIIFNVVFELSTYGDFISFTRIQIRFIICIIIQNELRST